MMKTNQNCRLLLQSYADVMVNSSFSHVQGTLQVALAKPRKDRKDVKSVSTTVIS